MKKLLISLLLLSSMAFCEGEPQVETEKESHNYMTFGIYAPVPVPMVGIGHRDLVDNQGIDLSLDIGSIIIGTFVNAHVKYIKYIENNYIAIGAKGTFAYVSYDGKSGNGIDFAPELTFGKDNKSTFHQINLSLPHISTDKDVSFVPVISYQYGLKF